MTLCVADLAGIVNDQPSVQLFSGTVAIRSVFLATKYVCIKQMDNLGNFSGAFPKNLLRRGWDSSEGPKDSFGESLRENPRLSTDFVRS
jgi:hypothetical protein